MIFVIFGLDFISRHPIYLGLKSLLLLMNATCDPSAGPTMWINRSAMARKKLKKFNASKSWIGMETEALSCFCPGKEKKGSMYQKVTVEMQSATKTGTKFLTVWPAELKYLPMD
jgi:hypothetical protein